jgi:hypothetical protein
LNQDTSVSVKNNFILRLWDGNVINLYLSSIFSHRWQFIDQWEGAFLCGALLNFEQNEGSDVESGGRSTNNRNIRFCLLVSNGQGEKFVILREVLKEEIDRGILISSYKWWIKSILKFMTLKFYNLRCEFR